MLSITIPTAFINLIKGVLLFIGGIMIGFLLIMLLYLIMTVVSKKRNARIKKVEVLKPIENTKDAIVQAIEKYKINSSNQLISKRVALTKEYSLDLIKEIARLYYPTSKEPYLEISLENFLNLSTDLNNKIQDTVREIVDSTLFKTVWKVGTTVFNTTNFLKGFVTKQKEDPISSDIHQMKIATILSMLDKIERSQKQKKEKENKKADLAYKNYFILDDFIQTKMISIISFIGEEADAVYSNKISQINEFGMVIK